MENNINLEIGLTQAQVEERIADGKVNVQPQSKTKTIGRIIKDNSLTLFNMLNIILALMIIFVESFQNLLFINIVIINTFIGIIQEIKAKKTIDKLSLISQPHVSVLRDGKLEEIVFEKIVMDDILILKAGKQIPSDSQVVKGEIEVNESLLTGESDSIMKYEGDALLSGSFVVSGQATVQVTQVGLENYASKLVEAVKVAKKPNSEIMKALGFIMKSIGIVIVPLGLLLLYKQLLVQNLPLQVSVTGTVAALIGMIPAGLVLLTSVALAVGVVRLGRHQTLVQELYCIETLARVDVLCLDKTGTITEGNMEVLSMETICHDKNPVQAIRALIANLKDDNATYRALSESCQGEAPKWLCERVIPFSSERKWSGAFFAEQGTFVIGAPEFVLKERYDEIKEKVEHYASEGNRVLMLGYAKEPFKEDGSLPENIKTIALLPMGDKIRHEAKKTLEFFRNQGVDIKVISGDNPITVSQVAHRAGLLDWDNFVDASTLTEDEDVHKAAQIYSVFGRVSPGQKRLLIEALKNQGHTVAMTGDGVNDVLALREADCSIAMAEGSDAVRQVSQLVLLDSNFASFTRVLMEGRRVINNITRAASLFLVKTMFSLMLAVIVIIANEAYPFVPIQLTLISALTIGAPSVFLALEPNKNRITGNFLEKVLKKSLPGALTVVFNVVLIMIVGSYLALDHQQISTLAVISTGLIGLVILFRVSQPLDNKRWALFFTMTVSFLCCVLFLEDFFFLVPIQDFLPAMLIVLGITILDIYPLLRIFSWIVDQIERLLNRHQKEKRMAKATVLEK
ncbi:cation-translocating P-type ATPase [Acetobacterium sp. K1/6]|jgi:ATPase, P-type (transporting), HAD superfamily, subfamily IC|uniref:cation-translocating P-type ATPase n=1 Tax=Acetobacterium sp. K1/6 TaxID=3055467 RepID=UPI002ACA6E20|nr:cation-translocating P-type ATPase [Acetobacterium sp. K1/6]MDZ5724741.1 cation-translocating P-type ATPase [Acetobacterium sp. K1/6]